MAESKDEGVVANHRDNLTGGLLGTGLVIELKYYNWLIDQEIFENASEFFKKALHDDQWKEGRDHFVKLHDDCPIMFARYIQFLYSSSYQYPCPWTNSWHPDLYSSRVTLLGDLVFGDHCTIIYDRFRPSRMRLHKDLGNTISEIEIERREYVKSDELQNRAEIDVSMYQLAYKYGIPSLAEFALTKLRQNCHFRCSRFPQAGHLTMFQVVNKMYPDFDFMDDKVKKVIAQVIAKKYRAIRTTDDEAAAGIRGWLLCDDELCFMAMDRLARLKDVEKDQSRDE